MDVSKFTLNVDSGFARSAIARGDVSTPRASRSGGLPRTFEDDFAVNLLLVRATQKKFTGQLKRDAIKC
jgi:hypothetical protein